MADIEKRVDENVRAVGSDETPNEGGTAADVGRPDLEPSLVKRCIRETEFSGSLTNCSRNGTKTIQRMQMTKRHRRFLSSAAAPQG